MRCAAARIAHIMKAIEGGDEIETLFGNGLRGSCLETDPVRHAVRFCMGIGLLDRRRVEVVAYERAFRKRLRHQQCREAHATADVPDFGASSQFGFDTIKSRKPGLPDGIDVTPQEECADGAEKTATAFAPRHSGAGAERALDLGLTLDHL